MKSNSNSFGPAACNGNSQSGPTTPATRTITGTRLGGNREYASYPELA